MHLLIEEMLKIITLDRNIAASDITKIQIEMFLKSIQAIQGRKGKRNKQMTFMYARKLF